MDYSAMMDVKTLIDGNYLSEKIDRPTYHFAIKGLHSAYAASNGLGQCGCLSCTYIPKEG